MTETELAILGADGTAWQQDQRATTVKDPAEWRRSWAPGRVSASGERVQGRGVGWGDRKAQWWPEARGPTTWSPRSLVRILSAGSERMATRWP